MAYKFKGGESIPEAVRRIVTDELESAAKELDGTAGTNREEAVHEARKSIKKTRAMLRLVKPELGAVQKTENSKLRDSGRKLSELRDAAAIVTSFDDLRAAFPNQKGLELLDPIREGLVKRRDEAMQHAGVDEGLQSMSKSFRASTKRVKRWPLNADGFAAIRTGLEDSYRAGRRAMARAGKQPRPENFHEWR